MNTSVTIGGVPIGNLYLGDKQIFILNSRFWQECSNKYASKLSKVNKGVFVSSYVAV